MKQCPTNRMSRTAIDVICKRYLIESDTMSERNVKVYGLLEHLSMIRDNMLVKVKEINLNALLYCG